MERVRELKDYYALPGGPALFAVTEGGTKILTQPDVMNIESYSGQGSLIWKVAYFRRNGRFTSHGPMDTKELRTMHPELFWGAEIDWTVHGIDVPSEVA
jgi:hypothetical protein